MLILGLTEVNIGSLVLTYWKLYDSINNVLSLEEKSWYKKLPKEANLMQAAKNETANKIGIATKALNIFLTFCESQAKKYEEAKGLTKESKKMVV